MVAGVIDETALELEVLAAESFFRRDDPEVDIGFVKGGEIVIDAVVLRGPTSKL